MRQINGFTLIELLSACAVLSMLLMFALPAYKSYTVRVKVSEAMSLAGPVTLAVTETYHSQGSFPVTNSEAGVPTLLSTSYVDKIDVTRDGKVVMTLDNDGLGLSSARDATLIFTPSVGTGRIVWDCVGGNLAQKYRPSACRI